MPKRNPHLHPEVRKAQNELQEALDRASRGHFQSALNLSCRNYLLRSESSQPDVKLRIWDAQVMVTVEQYFAWLEAVQEAYKTTGIMTAGYSTCVTESILYWFDRYPDHPYWSERWRALAEMPEFACWAEDIDRAMRAKKQGLDPIDMIA